MPKLFAVYILANKPRGTLYIGFTSNLPQRIYQHKHELTDSFSKRYHIHSLVWYQVHMTAESAIKQEKKLKRWKRQWKIKLIEQSNPDWKDLTSEVY